MLLATPMLLSIYVALITLVVVALLSFSSAMWRGSLMFTNALRRLFSSVHRPPPPESALFSPYTGNEELKMILVVRRDLKMTSGKVAAQCAHAAVALVEQMHDLDCIRRHRDAGGAGRPSTTSADSDAPSTPSKKVSTRKKDWLGWYDAWSYGGCAKVALQCANEEILLQLATHAKVVNLPYYIVHDAGRTQIASGSRTVLGIGPAPRSMVDKITGHLSLL